MFFDDPVCFRLGRIPVRPIYWLWRPYLASGNLASARPPGVCGKTANFCGYGRIRPCRTASVGVDESKADRPLSRAVSALRPWNEPRQAEFTD
jgi:hypothetical protein